MALMGNPRRHTFKFLWRLEGGPFNQTDTGFTTCSGLELALETVKHRQGGSLIPDKWPGLGDYPPITLSRGATTNVQGAAIAAWAELCLAAAHTTTLREGGAQGGRAPTELYKKTLRLIELSGAQEPIRVHTLYEAWISNFKPIVDLDNNASEVVMEEMTIEYRWFERSNPQGGVKVNLQVGVPGVGAANLSSSLRPSGSFGPFDI